MSVVCYASCFTIAMQPDEEGFLYPSIKMAECIKENFNQKQSKQVTK